MKRLRAALLLCSLCAATLGYASALQSGGGQTAAATLNRFGRQLRSYEQPVADYLVPTKKPAQCSGGSCCQEDDYASPYRLMMLNSTKAVFGGRTYTTFFMNLFRTFTCEQSLDFAGCCTANVSRIWVDVDPSLKVKYASMAGNPTAVTPQQDAYGFRLGISPTEWAQVSPNGMLLSVTVEGSVNQLCPVPDVGPIAGLCDVIVEGGTPSNAGACCPRGLTLPSNVPVWVPPTDYFKCVSEPSTSPFNLQQRAVSPVFLHAASGMQAVNYTLSLSRAASCREGLNSCCGMVLTYIIVKVIRDTQVLGLAINGDAYPFSTSAWNEDGQAGFAGLLIEGVRWAGEDVTSSTKSLTVTVRAAAQTNVPQLCSVPTQNADYTAYGACSFFLHSDDGYCCPSGATAQTTGPASPPAPPGTCEPMYPAPIADTSMTFAYYEYTSAATKTEFSFLVTNHNNATCAGSKPYCVDVCSWTLAVRDEVIPALTYVPDDPANTGRELVTRGDAATVRFTYGPSGAQSITYTIRAPANTPLTSVCRPNAHPDQGTWPCAAKVMSNGNVYSMVFFSQESVFIKNYPSPPAQPGMCDLSRPMTDSCMRVNTARFNSPSASSTVFDFLVGNTDPAVSSCVADAPDSMVTFKVLLAPSIVDELSVQKSLLPRDTAVFNKQSGVMWMWTPPVAGMTAHYTFNIAGQKTASEICVQGLPGQPANSCPVQFEGRINCFIGFVSPARDSALTWTVGEEGSSGASASASVIAPAVVVPIAVIALAAAGLFVFLKRRRSSSAASVDMSLAAPLNSDQDLQRGSVASAAASDVQIRLPSSSSQGPRS